MSNQSASRQFRERVGLPPLDESETPVEEPTPEELEEGDGDEGELDPGGPQPGADEDGFGGDAPEPQNTEPFPGDNV